MPFIQFLCFDIWGLVSGPTKWSTLGDVPYALEENVHSIVRVPYIMSVRLNSPVVLLTI